MKIGYLCQACCQRKNYKLYRLFEKGYDQLEKEMDLIKLVRGIRNLKIFNKVNGFNEHIKFIIKNSEKNIIDLDNLSDGENEDSSDVSEQDAENY